MVRGKKPIELGNSWFSAKAIEVVCQLNFLLGKALKNLVLIF